MVVMDGILHIEDFIENPGSIFDTLIEKVDWDERMKARKTASFGKAYNYSQIHYPYREFLPELEAIINKLETVVGFKPNNCLINYYMDGKSKMGYHSDQTDILEDNTGVAIVSLGATRALRFRNITDPEKYLNYNLVSGCLVYMIQQIQDEWQHAIPKADTDNGRLSLTFRAIK